MKAEAIQKICLAVYNSHPEVAGKKPKVSEQAPGRYLLLFKSSAETPTGKSIPHTIRVVSNEQGEIIKISASRG